MTILAATDFSSNARSALRAAAIEARRRKTDLTVLHSIDSVGERWEYLEETPSDIGNQVIETARTHLREEFNETVPRDQQPNIEEFLIREGPAAEQLYDLQQHGDYEQVVVGATGRSSLARMLLGSTAEEVVRSCDTPVLVVPRNANFENVDRILAPVDMSECSRASLSAAAARTRMLGAELLILHASTLPAGALALMEWEPSDADRKAHRNFTSKRMADFLENIDLEGIEHEEILRFGAPFQEIVDIADKRNIDLIIMGTHGRRGFERLFLGSTATKVLRRLPCSALTIRHKED